MQNCFHVDHLRTETQVETNSVTQYRIMRHVTPTNCQLMRTVCEVSAKAEKLFLHDWDVMSHVSRRSHLQGLVNILVTTFLKDVKAICATSDETFAELQTQGWTVSSETRSKWEWMRERFPWDNSPPFGQCLYSGRFFPQGTSFRELWFVIATYAGQKNSVLPGIRSMVMEMLLQHPSIAHLNHLPALPWDLRVKKKVIFSFVGLLPTAPEIPGPDLSRHVILEESHQQGIAVFDQLVPLVATAVLGLKKNSQAYAEFKEFVTTIRRSGKGFNRLKQHLKLDTLKDSRLFTPETWTLTKRGEDDWALITDDAAARMLDRLRHMA